MVRVKPPAGLACRPVGLLLFCRPAICFGSLFCSCRPALLPTQPPADRPAASPPLLILTLPSLSSPSPSPLSPPQSHFSQTRLNADLSADLRAAVGGAPRLLQAMVDVISSSGWLNPALAAMEMAQMVAQALWQRDPPLMQLPHVGRDLAARCAEAGES